MKFVHNKICQPTHTGKHKNEEEEECKTPDHNEVDSSVSPCDFRFRRAEGFTLQQSLLAFYKRVCVPILSKDLRRQL